jgi:6,7-dimethyl-8-ribityllumazine synthase
VPTPKKSSSARKATPASSAARAPRAPSVAIIVSRYNASITGPLLDGALTTFAQTFSGADQPEVFEAPGAYELPTLALHAALSERFDGVLALGCIIKGDTSHDRVIADAVAKGLLDVSLSTGVPVAFGVLTVDTPQQAQDRAGGSKGNKGHEAMSALLDSIDAINTIWTGQPSSSSSPKPDKAAKKTSRSTRGASA